MFCFCAAFYAIVVWECKFIQLSDREIQNAVCSEQPTIVEDEINLSLRSAASKCLFDKEEVNIEKLNIV